MRWKVKQKKPNRGDTRIIKTFAYLPTKIGDTWVWLERYGVEEKYFLYLSFWGEEKCRWDVYDTFLMDDHPGE
jgi:hypothetical protein